MYTQIKALVRIQIRPNDLVTAFYEVRKLMTSNMHTRQATRDISASPKFQFTALLGRLNLHGIIPPDSAFVIHVTFEIRLYSVFLRQKMII